jgi:hypothetical protein
MALKRRQIRIPSSLLIKLDEQLQRDGYKPNRRSKWVREAVYFLWKNDPMLMTAGAGDDLDGKRDDNFLLTGDTEFQSTLVDMVATVRAVTPDFPDPKALLIRTAIRYRLAHAEEASLSLKASSVVSS